MKFLGVLFLSLLFVFPTFGQEEHRGEKKHKGHDGMRKQKIESLKIAFLTKELELTPQESEKFWPIYNQYQNEIRGMRQDLRPTKKMDEMSDAEADELLGRMFEMQQRKLRMEQETMKRILPILGSKRVIKLTKAEGKFNKKVLSRAGKGKRKKEAKRKGHREHRIP